MIPVLRLPRPSGRPAEELQPLRAELFSADQMRQHGRDLAGQHEWSPDRLPDRLLPRLAENERVLHDTRDLLADSVKMSRRITPAGEWLLDNFYLIQEQIRIARRDLPKGYSRQLPVLRSGDSSGYPRVYDIALETISHGDGRVDPENLSSFVTAYQTVAVLELGELWAIPIVLRLALIENLRRVAGRMSTDRIDRNRADHWANQMTETARTNPGALILVVADMARSDPPMVSAFVAELARRLQGQGPALALPLTWIEQRLAASGNTIEHLVQSENQRQAADQVTISNSIGSLRFLSATDWRTFVERMSLVETVLRRDPGGVYPRMDFATRDRYRHAVEGIASRCDLSEEAVARAAVALAAGGDPARQADGRESHVGFYLIDRGLLRLETEVGARRSSWTRVRAFAARHALLAYLGPALILSLLLATPMVLVAAATGLVIPVLIWTALLALASASQLALVLMNRVVALVSRPRLLPRLDLVGGIPAELRTLVVVPTMIVSREGIEALVEALEVRFLANRDARLHFGLLTDLADAESETVPSDPALIEAVRERIAELNTRYPAEEGSSFYLFHRPRVWNQREQLWMGRERKRGKLSDLNALLRGRGETHFAVIIGDVATLSGVRYVITLDSDTQLPRDTARQLIASMAHPLNRPRYDPSRERITEGYGILQPRVSISMSGANRSRYAQLYGGEPGVDPYTRAVSDLYQDLFGEGSFVGKGIYDLDAFEAALGSRFPDNRILSHDLLEGCHARSGLLSDVQLYEEYPSRYATDVRRRYRWIRGDWQLVAWLLRSVPGGGSRRRRNPISGLSVWKLLDNLRRSLVAPALTLLLLTAWLVLTPPWFWTGAVLAVILLPPVVACLFDLLKVGAEVGLAQHLSSVARAGGRHFAQAALELACLPFEAQYSLNAIGKTWWRLLRGRRLLEWNPSSEAARVDGARLFDLLRTMWIGPALSIGLAIALTLMRPMALVPAAPVLVLWSLGPFIAWWISLPLGSRSAKLSSDQHAFLRKLARRTWRFFDTFVGPEDHFLPPDNFQELGVPRVAHRTSPTNMGVALLSNLAAYDFGYIPSSVLLQRTESAFDAMEALARHRGHFYNWYDTQTLEPLPPRYVSTVDSGNLSGHLLTLSPGLQELTAEEVFHPRLLEGMRDTLGLLLESSDGLAAFRIEALDLKLAGALENSARTLSAARTLLAELQSAFTSLASEFDGDPLGEPRYWAGALVRQGTAALDDLDFLAPWADLPAPPPQIKLPVELDRIPTLGELQSLAGDLTAQFDRSIASAATTEESTWFQSVRARVIEASRRASERVESIGKLSARATAMAEVEYAFLYDSERHLLSIGYDVTQRRRDTSFYDLLASEARLASFVAIAQEQLPQETWFALGRLLNAAGGDPVLLSWSGSMFEYLMPLLVMPTYEHSLLDQTYRAAVARQISHGRQHGVPWGVSESGYNTVDAQLNYQYRAFGVPGLGLKRGLAADLVIAPYASALALMVSPDEACANLERLVADGAGGRYGLFEALDYTPSRVPRGQSRVVVRSFMAHHQGMVLLSLDYRLLELPMQARFDANRQFRATTLLLQERIPKAIVRHGEDAEQISTEIEAGLPSSVRIFRTPHTPSPEVLLLSNGRYHVMVTNAGSGCSRWRELALTRWREDPTGDGWGTFCYIREVATGAFWSSGFQPTRKPADRYEAVFSEARAEFRRRDHGFETHTEIAVSPEDDVEVRRVQITNRSRSRREIEVTSYAEVVLTSPAADALHPAFSGLFVQTEVIREGQAILCTRRPRSKDEMNPWLFHLMAVHGAAVEESSYETDRERFIGRGNTAADPRALRVPGPLSGTSGSVLDPVVSIRHRVVLEPEACVTVNLVFGLGETREACLRGVEKYQDRRLADRVFDLAGSHSEVVLRQLNVTEADAQVYGRLAGLVIYANAALRGEAGVLLRNRRGQSGLWAYSISGDLPIVLLRISDASSLDLVRQLVQAHAYWRSKGLAVDLVIWNEDHAGYRQVLQDQITGLIAAGVETGSTERSGSVLVRAGEQIAEEDRILLQSVARVIIVGGRGSLTEQLDRPAAVEMPAPRLSVNLGRGGQPVGRGDSPSRDLLFENGFGGFAPDGREYVITVRPDHATPAPWVNVLSNPGFGTIVSERGAACTWSENAHEFRLTPWTNDPVSDDGGEAIYIRDDESGHFWSPTPLLGTPLGRHVCRHGFGYTVFECEEAGIRSELWVYVALDGPVKFSVLRLKNLSGRDRKLSVTGYVEWVIGDLRPRTAMHIRTGPDRTTGALLARNPYYSEFSRRVAFFDTDDPGSSFTCDRTEFLGRNGALRNPVAMSRGRLSGRSGVAFDPCTAIQVTVELGAGSEREVTFRLGAGKDEDEARDLVLRYRGASAVRSALERVRQHWKRTLGAVRVETPDAAFDLLANGWLLYQTLACRLWARSGFYQPGGAFGFRDQLQDAMALLHAEPGLLREHLLRCAEHQFVEGDVQHWWHPPSGRGVRTRCSDDYLWLPLAVSRYVAATGDTGLLDQSVPFLTARAVKPDEDSYYDLPERSEESGSVYEHCVRAVTLGLRVGSHGLPLIGTGDWNDGMNLVGDAGRGESVWLGFFLQEVLTQFSRIARGRGDGAFAARCELEAARTRARIEAAGWDGEWYLRAYFDDGTPLGSSLNVECQIDSIAQSWSVLSGPGDPGRARTAMDALDRRLVERGDRLVKLLDPPFDTALLDPGYIRGYPPGVRENGGQYTHAAIWAVMAFAALGERRRAWEILELLLPINHARNSADASTYRVEPYVVAADVYSHPPHTGRGGWTWYTGSAGWMYRLMLESILGLRLEGGHLRFLPALPPHWPSCTVHYRHGETGYHITFETCDEGPGVASVTLDGSELGDGLVPLVDDRRDHAILVKVPKAVDRTQTARSPDTEEVE